MMRGNRVWCILIWWNGVEPQPWGRISAAFASLSLCCIITFWNYNTIEKIIKLTARVFIGSDGLGWTWKIEDDQFCFVRFGDDDLVQFHGGMHSTNVGRFPTWHKLTSSQIFTFLRNSFQNNYKILTQRVKIWQKKKG